MAFLDTLLRAVTWWNDATIGTLIYTRRKGRKVGEDAQGNAFYESAEGKRWVIFNGETEASRVSPDWHGWLHYTFKEPPTEAPLPRKTWEKPHQENLTGTTLAYAPKGSIRAGTPEERRDYEAWSPE
jgi:NADH:ubiquinone oxidoreductase subunit